MVGLGYVGLPLLVALANAGFPVLGLEANPVKVEKLRDRRSYVVDVTDNGEPGREDRFSLRLSNGYFAVGTLAGGNIQLHVKPGPCP